MAEIITTASLMAKILQRLKRYQAYVDAAWSIIHVLHYLNETTEVEGAPDLKHNEDE